jgi:hypothetical protein
MCLLLVMLGFNGSEFLLEQYNCTSLQMLNESIGVAFFHRYNTPLLLNTHQLLMSSADSVWRLGLKLCYQKAIEHVYKRKTKIFQSIIEFFCLFGG